MPDFCHLHCHSQFSLLDGASEIGAMMDKAVKDNQKSIALTDHGNMFGAFKFVNEANKRNIKPIVGCEFYLVEDRHIQSFSRSKGEYDKRYHQVLLAKTKIGYQNLSKLCSLGFTEGYYQKYPRIDKELIEQYSEGLIATSCCLAGEIPQALIKGQRGKAENLLKWWLDIFGENYFIEIMRHDGLTNIDYRDKFGKRVLSGKSQEDINQELISIARKNNLKVIATNDSHYVEEEDSTPHEILLCINTGNVITDEKRFKFSSSDYYFKSQKEMKTLFQDIPEAIQNTVDLASEIETLNLARDVILPEFPLPPGFDSQSSYLRHLAFRGARKRYGEITEEIRERIDFELTVINNSGYPGYFLIVQDFTTTAREMNVSVGPGRGSAAGSAVAYCLGITNIDPIKYNLLFERFLNPERVSMPDIDIDFDDEGRSKVIDYVIDKYGQKQVAQIITYGTMAAKSSIRDVGRVLDVPLSDVNRIAKTFPSMKASLNDVLAEGGLSTKLKSKLNSDEIDSALQFRTWSEQDNQIGEMLQTAKKLEGSVRNTGIHACGVIITPDDITNYIPISTAKDSDLLVSQFDNAVVEDAGLLKMDFLGLKTLSIIKDALKIIKETTGDEIDIDKVPLDDPKTYDLFQKGETIAIFQYESPGMQKNLKALKPNQFEDLIAMNALYRPGPMDYIPAFIKRKHGEEEIRYDLPAMEEYLNETYGITVYQEQVMLLSQKLANFTKGQADKLRKGMGKKLKKVIDAMYPLFEEGCTKNGHPIEVVQKIWKDWEKFASYAFNKSHSTCYAFIAFQTAYLKANYPEAFMAAVLNRNRNDISKINFFLRECKRMDINVLGPDINESKGSFSVNKKGDIRFGLNAIKGVGEGPVEAIQEAKTDVKYQNIFELAKAVNLRSVNKKCLESLASSGALDSFNIPRATYFSPQDKYDSLIEYAIKFGQSYQKQKLDSATSLFGDISDNLMEVPKIKIGEEWSSIQKLEKEKEVVGIYLSGHPLDDYLLEIKNFVNCPLNKVDDSKEVKYSIAGIVTSANHGVSRTKGLKYCRYTIQDYTGSFEGGLYREDYASYAHLMELGQVIFIEGKYRKIKNSDRSYFTHGQIKLLATLMDEKIAGINIRIPIERLSFDSIDNLTQLFDSNQGNKSVQFLVCDSEVEMDMVLKSDKVHIALSNDLINKIENMGYSYKLIKTKY